MSVVSSWETTYVLWKAFMQHKLYNHQACGKSQNMNERSEIVYRLKLQDDSMTLKGGPYPQTPGYYKDHWLLSK